MRRNVTLYLDLGLFQAYRKKISPTPISQDFEAHMRKNMDVPNQDQASSTASVDTSTGKEPSYDELLHKYESIVEAAGKRRKYLITEKVYDDLCKLAEFYGTQQSFIQHLKLCRAGRSALLFFSTWTDRLGASTSALFGFPQKFKASSRDDAKRIE